tara:strand:+ start:440 stop:598 length:159 start_codon:yes stop_codon:yes gene_type:complete
MKKIIQDYGVLIICLSISLIICYTIDYFFDYAPLFGSGFFAGALYFDWYKKK